MYPIMLVLWWWTWFARTPAGGEIPSASQRHPSPPVLSFPESGLDDSAAYHGYQTRFYRDAAGNTLQIYLDGRSGRVVHLWADAEDESAGVTVRDGAGQPVALRWGSAVPTVSTNGRARVFEYELIADAARVDLGLFLLGSMRVERDFQYADRHRQPFASALFVPPEMDRLLAALERLDPQERRRHLAFLNASTIEQIRSRLRPAITSRQEPTAWTARVVQPSLDARDTLTLEVRADSRRLPHRGPATSSHSRIALRTKFPSPFASPRPESRSPRSRVKKSLRQNSYRSWPPRAAATPCPMRARWLEREVRGVELLVVAREADGRSSGVRHVLRPRHAGVRAHDAPDLARRHVGVRDRERTAQARAARRREPRGGVGRSGRPRSGERVRRPRRRVAARRRRRRSAAPRIRFSLGREPCSATTGECARTII